MKVGFILPLGESRELGRPPSYAEIRAQARQAEAAGFDSVWLYDHLLYRFPDRPQSGVHECWSILGGLAEATTRVELGTLVLCAPWRDPALLAKMAVTMDEVSGGRLILGVGAGWHEPEFTAFGYPFDHLASRFAEALRIIAPLLKEGKVDFQGTYVSANDCVLLPRGPRPDGPPLLVAGKGPRMLRLTAEYADQWNMAWFGRVSASAQRRAEMDAACRAAGRDPRSLVVTAGVLVVPGKPEAGSEPIDPDRMLSGTPEEVAAGLAEYAEAGVDHVILNAARAGSPAQTSTAVEELGRALELLHGGSRA